MFFIKLLWSLFIFGMLLFLVYSTTRYFAVKAKKVMKGKYINVVDSVNIGFDKQLHLIEVGEKYILVSTSGKNVEFLTNVESNNMIIEKNEEELTLNKFEFSSYLENYVELFKNKIMNKKEKHIQNEPNNIETKIKSDDLNNTQVIKSNLDKLRNIKFIDN